MKKLLIRLLGLLLAVLTVSACNAMSAEEIALLNEPHVRVVDPHPEQA